MQIGRSREAPDSTAPALRTEWAGTARRRLLPDKVLRGRDIQLYALCDDLTEALLYLLVVFGPWAFGATEPWSIWVINIGSYSVGLLLAVKLLIRMRKGYQAPTWEPPVKDGTRVRPRRLHARRIRLVMAGLTFATLAYCLLGALNSAATYLPGQLRFDYHAHLSWLPHSFDSRSTWFAFWNYCGLACAFWAVGDWLLGKTHAEQRAERRLPIGAELAAAPHFPGRLRRLLWVLALNGGVLACESLIQRLANCPRLLFLVLPDIHQTAASQFGPYAYRANGAQYFNLLWPVCLGFWWTLHRGEPRGWRHHLLLLCGVLMGACPLVSTSRGGALVAAGIAVLGAASLVSMQFLFSARRGESPRRRLLTSVAVVLFFGTALALGYSLGWKELKPRMHELDAGFENREELYDAARRIARDYPAFGTGPGTYESVSELYRPAAYIDSFWPAQVHNDWLETRITFGWVGSALLYTALALVLVRWFFGGGIHGGRRFVTLLWLALAGCLVHARFDFPFQVHSLVFLFLILGAIQFNLSRHP